MEEIFKYIGVFASSSLITLVIKSIFDHIIKHFEFKRDLKKSLYIKKIEAAENLYKLIFHNYQSTLILITSIDELLDSGENGEQFEHAWDTQFESIQKNEQEILSATGSLYFKLDNPDIWSTDDLKEYIKVMSKINAISIEIETLDANSKEYESKIDDLITYFKNLTVILKKLNIANWAILENIKDELKN